MKNNDNHYYVYCLIDPTNRHQPFYVGKGVDQRGESHFIEKYEDKSVKNRKIKSIRAQGYEPYVRRFMWGLDESTALTIETALINCLDGLLNKSQGQNLTNVRKKADFIDWTQTYPGVDVAMSDKMLEILDAQNESTSFFLSKTKAYNAAGSNHQTAIGSYHTHKKCGIRMWTGDLRNKKWINKYDPDTGTYFIGIDAVMKRHGSWEEIITKHKKLTLNKKDGNNKFLCFTKGLSPNEYIKFLGVYEDDWMDSKNRNMIVRKRLSTTWEVSKK